MPHGDINLERVHVRECARTGLGEFFRTDSADLSDRVSVTHYYFEWLDYSGGEAGLLSFRAFAP